MSPLSYRMSIHSSMPYRWIDTMTVFILVQSNTKTLPWTWKGGSLLLMSSFPRYSPLLMMPSRWKMAPTDNRPSSLLGSTRFIVCLLPCQVNELVLCGRMCYSCPVYSSPEAPWTLNETSTLVQHENKGVPLLEHLENNVEPSKSALILEALKEWATNHETSDFYTLGLDLQLPTIQGLPWP